MPTKLPTQAICLNCNHQVQTENKYCPSCGQENADKRISLFLLLEDAVSTVFNFESRVFKTIPYFLFYPGRLTNEFLGGKRVRYMHPFKIYLLSSILFFFVAIQLFTPALEDTIRQLDKQEEEITIGLSLEDSIKASNEDKNDFVKGFEVGVAQQDSLDSVAIVLSEKFEKKQIALKDSISQIITIIKKGELNDSTINLDSLKNLVKDSALLAETILLFDKKTKDESDGLRRFFRLIQDRDVTPEALLDSLGTKNKDAITIQFAEQLLKIGRNDPAIFLANIINNIGTLMFFTLPILAFFFMPFYLRRKKYYIDHLIFTLHLQAFTFIILTFITLCFNWDFFWVGFILFFGLIIYVWFAFKKVYKQGFFKTTIKACMISFLYVITLIFMLSANLMYSFFMF